MRPAGNIKGLIKSLHDTTSAEMDERVLKDVLKALGESKRTKSAASRPNIWRIIMKSKITKFAAAAVIILIVAFSITLLDKSTAPVYAIEQTIRANQSINCLNFKYYDPHKRVVKKSWIEYDQNENIRQIRVDLYGWGDEDDEMIEVWNKGKTLIWNRRKSRLEFLDCNVFTAKMLKFTKRYDPKQAIEHLYKMQQEGKAKIEIKEGSNKDESIRITGRYLPGTYLLERPDLPGFTDVLVVNPKTKLVTEIEIYKVVKDQTEFKGVYKDYDYRPFDSNIFDIEKEIPDDVMRIVHYNSDDVNNLGVEQGQFDNKQIAVVIVRDFFDALITKDYRKVGRLFGGMPADEAELRFGRLNVVSVVSIGEQVRDKKFSSNYVPCIIEVEENGKKNKWQPKVFIGQVYRHNSRWRIMGVI